MNAKKSPLAQVNEQGGKEKLVDRIMGLIDHAGEDADDLRRRLLAASNKKLLRLANVGETLKDKYGGSTEKLAESVAQAVGRAKDSDYVKVLSSYSPARLLDLAQTLAKRAGAGARAATGTARAAVAEAATTVKKTATKARAAAKDAGAKVKAAAKTAAAKGKAAAKKSAAPKKK